MTYQVVVTATARHNLRSIPRPIAVRIGEEIASLADEADPKAHLKKLKGSNNPPFLLAQGRGLPGNSFDHR
ncbi:MAG: type II toxin-antitoxin system RelE family toxin [Methanoculleus sp.]|jgi:mRNA interferase RelE/StbE